LGVFFVNAPQWRDSLQCGVILSEGVERMMAAMLSEVRKKLLAQKWLFIRNFLALANFICYFQAKHTFCLCFFHLMAWLQASTPT